MTKEQKRQKARGLAKAKALKIARERIEKKKADKKKKQEEKSEDQNLKKESSKKQKKKVHHLHVPKDSNKNKLGINKEMLEKTENKEEVKEEGKS